MVDSTWTPLSLWCVVEEAQALWDIVLFWAENIPKANSMGGKFILLLPQRGRQSGQEWAHGAAVLTHPEVKNWKSRIFFSRIYSVFPRGILGISAQADECLGESLSHATPLPLKEAASVALLGPEHHKAKHLQMQNALSWAFCLLRHSDMSHCCLLLICWLSGNNFLCFGDKQILATSWPIYMTLSALVNSWLFRNNAGIWTGMKQAMFLQFLIFISLVGLI